MIKTILKYCAYTFFPTLLLCLIGIVIWQWNINNVKVQQEKDVSEIIENTVRREIKRDVLLPEVVLINADSSINIDLSEELIKEITTSLTQVYLSENEEKNTSVSMYSIREIAKKDGVYQLDGEQLEKLSNHLDFLTERVSEEVDRTKEEVGRDIDRLNTWVSIWIGVIGFMGIFIPIILNIDISKRASDAKNDADKAKEESKLALEQSKTASKEASDALTQISAAKEDIDKVKGLETKVNIVEEKIGGIEGKAQEASSKADNAIRESEVLKGNLSIIIAINALRDFSPQTIIHIRRNEILPQYKRVLSLILSELKANESNYDNDLMRNWLNQIAINLQNISFYKFIDQEQTEKLNGFANRIAVTLENYSEQNFKELISGFDRLIDELV